MASVMRCADMGGYLLVDFYFPGDLALGLAEGGGDRTVFFHRQFAGFFCLVPVDLPFQFEDDMYFLPEGRVFSFFTGAVDDHAEALNGLSLFLKDRDDIDAAAAAQTHVEHLHGTNAEVPAPGLGAGVHAGGMSKGVFGFEAEIPLYPAEFNPHHRFFLQIYDL